MSSATLSKVRSEALELPELKRAELARDLLASLDGPPDTDAEAAWDAEISRRLDQVNEGGAHTVDADEVIQRIKRRLSHK